jgi:hypothetical protein
MDKIETIEEIDNFIKSVLESNIYVYYLFNE